MIAKICSAEHLCKSIKRQKYAIIKTVVVVVDVVVVLVVVVVVPSCTFNLKFKRLLLT